MADKQTLEKNSWTTKSKMTVYENAWIEVEHHQVINPSGNDGIYGKVKFKNLAIGIIPLDEDSNTWLIGQYRYTLGQYSWEIPMGGGLLNVDPLESAKRELKEETGISASKWTRIMKLHTSNCVTDETAYVYVAEGLSHGNTQFDDTEDLKVWKISFDKAYEMALNGEITDAISIAGIFKLAALISRK